MSKATKIIGKSLLLCCCMTYNSCIMILSPLISKSSCFAPSAVVLISKCWFATGIYIILRILLGSCILVQHLEIWPIEKRIEMFVRIVRVISVFGVARVIKVVRVKGVVEFLSFFLSLIKTIGPLTKKSRKIQNGIIDDF